MADTPFSCSNDMLLITETNTAISLYNVNTNTLESDLQVQTSISGTQYTTFAYNAYDNFIYAGSYTPPGTVPVQLLNLVRIDSESNITNLGVPPGLPVSIGSANFYQASYIDKNGFWYIVPSYNPSVFYTIDMRSDSATFLKLVDPTKGYTEQTSNYGTPFSAPVVTLESWVMASNGLLYGIVANILVDPLAFNFISVDPTTGTVTQIPTVPSSLDTYDGFYAMAIDKNDLIYSVTQLGRLFYTFKLENGTMVGNNVGALDSSTPIPMGALMCPFADPDTNVINNLANWDVADCEGTTTSLISNNTNVEIIEAEITKAAKCSWTLPGGVISYCATLNNPGTIDFISTTFRDTLDSRLTYLQGTFTVDGVAQTPTVNGQTIEFGLDVLAGQEVTICFKARLIR